MNNLDFEAPILALEEQIANLSSMNDPEVDFCNEISALQDKLRDVTKNIYDALTPWQTVQVARSLDRPKLTHYIDSMTTDYFEICGDRSFGDDTALKCGIGRIGNRVCMINGHNKGVTLEERVKNSFGMPKPEGYRKLDRAMRMADKFGMPIINLIDSTGAYPGIEGEERGQCRALADCINTCFEIDVPIIAIIIGEGGSGGAIAMASADHVAMLTHSVYYTISPEGCSSILWKSADHKETAAAALKITSNELLKLKIIDKIITEPLGGAHRNPAKSIQNVQDYIMHVLNNSVHRSSKNRRERFLYNYS